MPNPHSDAPEQDLVRRRRATSDELLRRARERQHAAHGDVPVPAAHPGTPSGEPTPGPSRSPQRSGGQRAHHDREISGDGQPAPGPATRADATANPQPTTPGAASRGVRLIYSQVRRMPQLDRQYVARQLREELGIGGLDEIRQGHVAIVRRFVAERPDETGKRSYIRWRGSHGDELALPSAGVLQRSLGKPDETWGRVLEVASVQLHRDFSARELVSNGRLFTIDELHDALRLFARETTGALTQPRYLEWVASRQCRDGARLPRSLGPFRDLGTWLDVLRDLGLQDRCGGEAPRRRRAPVTREMRTMYPVTPEHWSHRRVRDALRRALEAVGDPETGRLHQPAYLRWAEQQNDVPAGDQLVAPGLFAIRRCFGAPWATAMVEAGVQAPNDVRRLSGSAQAFSRDQLLNAGVDAVAELGPDMSGPMYARWRIAALKAAIERGEELRVPTDRILTLRLGGGSWPHTRTVLATELARRNDAGTTARPKAA